MAGRLAHCVLTSLLLLNLPSAARAQTQSDPGWGINGYVTLGSSSLAADQTFDAIADTHTHRSVGGGIQLTRIWRRAFADVAVSRQSIDGERVFVADGRVFRVGIPLEAKMFPVDVAGGWRFGPFRRRLTPYAGAGFTYLRYRETSSFAGSTAFVDSAATGPLMIGGVDVSLWRRVSAGADVRWRRVTGILGAQGASTEFDEEDAGGISLGVRVIVGM